MKKYSTNSIQEWIKNRQLRLISIEYQGGLNKHEWECLKCGYFWWASPFNVVNKTGCPKCAGNARLTIEEMQNIAKSRRGTCLSTKYINSRVKLQWECHDGHTWFAAPTNIKQGRWCPFCKSSLVEEKCRFVFESFTKEKFPKSRNTLNNKWELDGFCKKLQLAFEYQGIQHYKRVKKWYTLKAFQQLQIRDKQKTDLCYQKNIKKINIPYYEVSTDNKLVEFIKVSLQQNHIKIIGSVIWDNFIHYPTKLSLIKSMAKKRNIDCISTSYNIRMEFKCYCGYIWNSKIDHFKNGHGCPRCAGRPKYTIDDMRVLAKQKNGYCRSNKYINEVTKLVWECCCGNVWKAAPHNIKLGKWCPICGRKKGWLKRKG